MSGLCRRIFGYDFVLLIGRACGRYNGRRRCGDIFFVRNDGLSESDTPFAPCACVLRQDRAEASFADAFGRVPLHPSALSYRCEDALVRQPPHGQPRGSSARCLAGMGAAHGECGEGHYSVAACAVGAGYPRRDRFRRGQSFRIPPLAVETYAHRRAARAAEPDQTVERAFSESSVRHELRTFRVDRSRMRASRSRKHTQGRRDRQGGLPLGDRHC